MSNAEYFPRDINPSQKEWPFFEADPLRSVWAEGFFAWEACPITPSPVVPSPSRLTLLPATCYRPTAKDFQATVQPQPLR